MRILIVEDDLVSRKLLEKLLAPLGCCDLAASGDEAIRLFGRRIADGRSYELVCLDIMLPAVDGQQVDFARQGVLPGADGQQVLKALRLMEQEHSIPAAKKAKIFMISALSSPEHIREAFERGGCDEYLIKPIDRNGLYSLLYRQGLIPLPS